MAHETFVASATCSPLYCSNSMIWWIWTRENVTRWRCLEEAWQGWRNDSVLWTHLRLNQFFQILARHLFDSPPSTLFLWKPDDEKHGVIADTSAIPFFTRGSSSSSRRFSPSWSGLFIFWDNLAWMKQAVDQKALSHPRSNVEWQNRRIDLKVVDIFLNQLTASFRTRHPVGLNLFLKAIKQSKTPIVQCALYV